MKGNTTLLYIHQCQGKSQWVYVSKKRKKNHNNFNKKFQWKKVLGNTFSGIGEWNVGSGCLKMVKIDTEAFKNRFEKYLSEMICSQSLKHRDVLLDFSGPLWPWFLCCDFKAFSVKPLSLKLIFFYLPAFS